MGHGTYCHPNIVGGGGLFLGVATFKACGTKDPTAGGFLNVRV